MTDAFDELGLARRAIRGDEEALTALLENEATALRERIASRIGAPWRSVLDADDVLQITYMEAFLRIDRFEPQGAGSFRAWLQQIAENNLRDAIKSLERAKRPDPRKRVHGPPGEQSFVALVEVLGVTSTTPSRQAAGHELQGVLDHALRQLPPDYERVIRMYDLEARPVNEVAAAMGRSGGAVFMLRARAHDRLKEILGSSSKFFSSPG